MNLSKKQEQTIVFFFLKNPQVLGIEHVIHTRNPLDNLCHYMWEELFEPEHALIALAYRNRKYFLDEEILRWFQEELTEFRRKYYNYFDQGS